MLKQLISLVLLLIFISYKGVFADTNIKILPEAKPKRILNIVKEKKDKIIPQKKPFFIRNKAFSKNTILVPKKKPYEIVKNNIPKKKSIQTRINEKEINNYKVFLLPEKKTNHI